MGLWKLIVIAVAAVFVVVIGGLAAAVTAVLIINLGNDFDVDRLLGIVGAIGGLASVLALMINLIKKWFNADNRDE